MAGSWPWWLQFCWACALALVNGVAAAAVGLAAAGCILGAVAAFSAMLGAVLGADVLHRRSLVLRWLAGIVMAVLFAALSPAAVAFFLCVVVLPLLWALVLSLPWWGLQQLGNLCGPSRPAQRAEDAVAAHHKASKASPACITSLKAVTFSQQGA